MNMSKIEKLLDNPGWNFTWDIERDLSGSFALTPTNLEIIQRALVKAKMENAKLAFLIGEVETQLRGGL